MKNNFCFSLKNWFPQPQFKRKTLATLHTVKSMPRWVGLLLLIIYVDRSNLIILLSRPCQAKLYS